MAGPSDGRLGANGVGSCSGLTQDVSLPSVRSVALPT